MPLASSTPEGGGEKIRLTIPRPTQNSLKASFGAFVKLIRKINRIDFGGLSRNLVRNLR